MKKNKIITLRYKMFKMKPKNGEQEPDWEAMKISPDSVKHKYDTEVVWVKKTFETKKTKSIEEHEEGSVINHKEGVFIVNTGFKKLFKLIYK